jgi:hypothetical protein
MQEYTFEVEDAPRWYACAPRMNLERGRACLRCSSAEIKLANDIIIDSLGLNVMTALDVGFPAECDAGRAPSGRRKRVRLNAARHLQNIYFSITERCATYSSRQYGSPSPFGGAGPR